MSTIPVWQTDSAGFLVCQVLANELAMQPGVFNVPYGAYTDAPEPAPAGYVTRRIDDAWVQVEDYRAETLYISGTDTEYKVGSSIDIDGEDYVYDGSGPMPDWLSLSATLPPLDPDMDDSVEVVDS